MGYREFDSDLDRVGRVGGRRFVAPEGRNQFLDPTYESDAGDTSPNVSRSVALKLVVMAVVMLGLLFAAAVILT